MSHYTASTTTAAATATYNHDGGDYVDDDDLGLSAMMAQAVISSTSGGREGRRDEKRDHSRSRSSSILRRSKKEGDRKNCAPSTPRRRGGSREFDLIDNDNNKNKRCVGRSRSGSVLRRMLGSGKNNSATVTTNITPISTAATTATATATPTTRCSEDDCFLTTGTNTMTTNTASTKNNSDNRSKVERKKSSSKKEAKKIKRSNNGKYNDNDDDDNDDDDDDDTSSRRSSNSKKSTENNQNKKKKSSKQHYNKMSSSRVEAIREPILTTEGAVIKDEMDNLFPSPKPSERKTMAAATTTTKTTATTTKTIFSFDSNDLTSTNDDDCDRVATQLDSSIRSDLSLQRNSQKSSGSGSGAGSSFSCGIMSNKAAEEHAEEVLNRVAAHQQMEKNNNSNNSFGSSFRVGMDVGGGGDTYRRISSSSGSSRRSEQYQRLHRDSGLASVDDDESCRSQSSRRSMSSNVFVSALNRKLDEHKKENDDLRQQLSEASANIVQLNDELQFDKDRSKMAKARLCRIEKEKSFLIESVRDMEKDFVAKDERIKKLQHVVETQLDTVEFLEGKLVKTEEELVLTENELNALIIVVENKVVIEEGVSDRVSNESSHASNKQGRLARMGSMREDMTSRKDSIKIQEVESRRLLFNESVITESSRNRPPSTHQSSSMNLVASSIVDYDVDERENQLKLRELKLEANREKYNLQEKRLYKWERDLLEMDDQLKKENNKITDDGGTSQAKLSRREVASELTVVLCSLEAGNEELPQLDRENGEIDPLIESLRKENENLQTIHIEDREELKWMKKGNENLRMKFQSPSF